jgi:hypothetical protein
MAAFPMDLMAGRTYDIGFTRTSGTADLRYYVVSLSASATSRALAGTEYTGPSAYTASATGRHAVIVVNDNGAAGTFLLTLASCTPLPALSQNAGVALSSSYVGAYTYQMSTNQRGYAVVGVRGPWQARVYQALAAAPGGSCFATSVGVSAGGNEGGVRLLAGNLNLGTGWPLSPWYLEVAPDDCAAAAGMAEWDSGSDALTVNGQWAIHALGGSQVLDAYDITLQAGTTYSAHFLPDPGLGAHVLLFPPGPSPGWWTREDALFDSPTGLDFTPVTSGRYGIVVVADGDVAGNYMLLVSDGSLVAVGDPPAPARTELRSVAPNPARGRIALSYALAAPGRVAFDVVDLAGRRVTRIDDGTRAAGLWTAAWDGRAASGARVGAGVYFLRFRVDGRAVAERRVVRLD